MRLNPRTRPGRKPQIGAAGEDVEAPEGEAEAAGEVVAGDGAVGEGFEGKIYRLRILLVRPLGDISRARLWERTKSRVFSMFARSVGEGASIFRRFIYSWAARCRTGVDHDTMDASILCSLDAPVH